MQIKKVEDYFEALYKKYPDVPKNDINTLLIILVFILITISKWVRH